jgi:hypothetical protein
VTHPSTWNRTIGAITWSEKSLTRESARCDPIIQYRNGGGSTASASSDVWVTVPLKGPSTAGNYSVDVWMNLSFVASWSIAHKSCPLPKLTSGSGSSYCQISAGYSVLNGGTIELIDTKNPSVAFLPYPYVWGGAGTLTFADSSSWYYFTYCSGTKCTTSNSSTGPTSGITRYNSSGTAIFRSVPFSSTHTYVLVIEIPGQIQASIDTGGCTTMLRCWDATAQASLDLASSGGGFRLNYVYIH